ncbi:ATP-dependent DNA helicase DinG, partial [mine drainage metagenome]
QGRLEVRAAPLEADVWLAERVWKKALAVVATSATLRTLGSFSTFMRRSGMDRAEGARAMALTSPFDLGRMAKLDVPRMGCSPKDEERYVAAALAQLDSVVDRAEGTLVLCASRALMEALVERLPVELKAIMRCQGDKPVAALLEDHSAAIEAGKGSLLFGLATMAEGVDLPGALCRHVVVVKLPFASPDDPLSRARQAWMERSGRSVFAEVML